MHYSGRDLYVYDWEITYSSCDIRLKITWQICMNDWCSNQSVDSCSLFYWGSMTTASIMSSTYQAFSLYICFMWDANYWHSTPADYDKHRQWLWTGAYAYARCDYTVMHILKQSKSTLHRCTCIFHYFADMRWKMLLRNANVIQVLCVIRVIREG